MCRLLAAIGLNPRGGWLTDVFKAFVESSRRDDYLAKLTEGRSFSHDDGWGIAGVGIAGSEYAVLYHRSLLPIFHSHSEAELEFILDRLRRYDKIYFISHARKSSRREPYGEEFVHPFKYEFEKGVAWFAHNGGVDKRSLGKVLKVNHLLRVDSDIAGLFIVDRLSKCTSEIGECVADAYKELTGYVPEGGALNTLLLLLSETGPRLYVSYFYKEATKGIDRLYRDYYKVFSLESDDYIAVSSSTLLNYYNTSNVRELEEGLYELSERGLRKLSTLGG